MVLFHSVGGRHAYVINDLPGIQIQFRFIDIQIGQRECLSFQKVPLK